MNVLTLTCLLEAGYQSGLVVFFLLSFRGLLFVRVQVELSSSVLLIFS